MNASVRQQNYMAIDTLRGQKFQGTKVPRKESSTELLFSGAKGPGNKLARERES